MAGEPQGGAAPILVVIEGFLEQEIFKLLSEEKAGNSLANGEGLLGDSGSKVPRAGKNSDSRLCSERTEQRGSGVKGPRE